MSTQTDPAAAQAHADLSTLNKLRLEEDLTYLELASQIGLDAGALYRILNGQSDPIDRSLFKIRRFLEEREPTKRAPKRRAS